MTIHHEPTYIKVNQAAAEDDSIHLKCELTMEVAQRQPIHILCLNISSISTTAQFTFITTLLFAFSLLSAALDEFMFRSVQGFRFPLFMTAWELFVFSVIAVIEARVKGDPMFAFGVWKRSAPIQSHAAVALSMSVGRALGNASLQMLNFPTQVVFKSAKLVIVMLTSLVFHRDLSLYSVREYAAAASLTSSAALFALGDSIVSNRAHEHGVLLVGVVLVLTSLVFSSVHTNSQELILDKYNASVLEVMVFGNLIGAVFALISCLLNRELLVAISFCFQQPRVILLLTIRSCSAYMGVLCFVVLIKRWNCVVATTVTTCRKICTLVLSFIIFPKPFTFIYAIAAVLFIIGAYLNLVKNNKSNTQNPKIDD